MSTTTVLRRSRRKKPFPLSIFVPFTRDWCVARFFDSLDASDVPVKGSALTVYVDSDDTALLDAVTDRAKRTEASHVVVHFSGLATPGDVDRKERRRRHAAMRSASTDIIPDAELLLLLEDDTPVPEDAWAHLKRGFDAGYDWVCGFEVSRWSRPVPGVWLIEDGKRVSATPSSGLQRVHATGLYLVLTTPELYRSADWSTWDESMGHDVSVTYEMTRKGHRLAVDWDLRCIHATEQGDLTCDIWKPLTKTIDRIPRRRIVTSRTSPEAPVRKKHYRLGIDVTFNGVEYPKGTRIDGATAAAMSAAGVIAAKIPRLPHEIPEDERVEYERAGRLVIGAYVHMYPPVHNAGAEHMLHAMLAECVRRGIECRVGVEGPRYDGSEYVHDGVRVGPVSTLDGVSVMLTHLDRTPQAEDWCSERGVPCVHIFHNHLRPAMSRNIALGVYNTDWLLNKHPVDAPSVMIHPPVNPDDYRVERGDSVTLINLSEAKGAPIFYQLAAMRPDLTFLGVKGAYGKQVEAPDAPNLTIMENQADVRRVYERTRVLLMPSGYESYGRCAIEACCSGIPVIAADTPGLRECLGDAGVFPKRYDAASWAEALDTVLADYDRYSRLAFERAATLDPAYDVARFIGALETLI